MNLVAPAFILLALCLDLFSCSKSSTRAEPAVPHDHVGRDDPFGFSGPDCNETPSEQETTVVEVFTKPVNAGFYPEYTSTKFNTLETLSRMRIFDPSKPTYLIIHGFLRGCLRDIKWARQLISNLLRKKSCNVLYADWKHKSGTWNYFEALKSVPGVAEELYNILGQYEMAFQDFDRSKVSILAFSLGTHVAGHIGQLASGNIYQITAIEPASAGWTPKEPEKIISKDDAQYVLVYHSSEILSTNLLVGDKDIFFEDGSDQPQCSPVSPLCNHFAGASYAGIYCGKCIMVGYNCSSFKKFSDTTSEAGECGFCRDNSDCIGVGFSWQYDEDVDFRPKNLPPKTESLVPWRRNGTKYFVKMSEDMPFCTFTYQIVLKLAAKDEIDFNYLTFRLVSKERPDASVDVEVSNRIGEDRSLDVFASSMLMPPKKVKSVSGSNVFTAMLVVQNNTKLYLEMPVRFSLAILVDESYCLLGCSTKVDIKTAEMYVNFMSHHAFEKRAIYSGPVKLDVLDESKRKKKLKKTTNRQSKRKKTHRKKTAKPARG